MPYTAKVIRPDGTELDITQHLANMYDLILGSMDFGSGFFSSEDIHHIRQIQMACGFERLDYHSDKCKLCGHDFGFHRELNPGCMMNWRDSVTFEVTEECDCPGYAPIERELGDYDPSLEEE